MATYIAPTGNPEVWNEKPKGYFTPEEWQKANPVKEPEADPEAERLARAETIKLELNGLDLASIRPLREIDNGTDTQEDHERLLVINRQAVTLREELRRLTGAANA